MYDLNNLLYIIMQVKKLVNEAEDLDSIRTDLIGESSRQEEQEVGFRISKAAVGRRKSKPTGGKANQQAEKQTNRRRKLCRFYRKKA
jgi:hypothetical protein